MKFFWLTLASFIISFVLCWLAWLVGLPLPWIMAVGIAQVGVLWWRTPWAVGSCLGLFGAGITFFASFPVGWLLLGIAACLLQWTIPTVMFQRQRYPFDLSTSYALVFGLLYAAGLNTGASAILLGIIGWRSGVISGNTMPDSIAVIWLVHYLAALVITIPLLRYGTQYVRHRGMFASPAAFQRGIHAPKVRRNDILFLLMYVVFVVVLYTAVANRIGFVIRSFNVLLLFPIAYLMYQRGLDGVLLASPISIVTGLGLLFYGVHNQESQRSAFASTIFELGLYYLICVVVGMLLDNQREEQRKLKSVGDVNRLFLSHDKHMLQHFVERVRSDMNATSCVVMDYDSEQHLLQPRAWTSVYAVPKRLVQPLVLTQFPDIEIVVQQRQARAFHSIDTAIHSSTSAFWVETGYTSALWVPLNGTNSPVGMVAILDERPERFFTPNEIGFVSAICVHVAAAFEQNRLISGLREKTEQLRVVSHIAATLNASLNDDFDVYRRIAQQIALAIPYDWGCVALATSDETRFRIVVETGSIAVPLADNRLRLSQNTLQHIHNNNGTPYRLDIRDLPQSHAFELRNAGLGIVLVVPIRRDNRWLGVLVLASFDSKAFSEAQQDLLQMLIQHMALAISNAQLYQTLDETYRAKEVAHEALLQTERLRALGELSTGIAHDFNNLLTGILGHTQLMMIDAPVQQHEGLEIIEQAARDGRRMIERIQQFARSQQPHRLEMVQINDIVDDVVQLTRPRWYYRSGDTVIKTTVIMGTIPPIYGSPFALREVLMNLILNAIDAMPEGGELRIFTSMLADGVLLEVSDSGIGMDEVTRTRMWEPFFSTKGDRGTGLGLSMTHTIVVQQHGGTINVESRVGEGTIIRITFPVPVDAPPESVPSPAYAVLEQQLRILVAENDVRVRSALEGLLSNAGYVVFCAETGQQALAAYERHSWDILIADSSLTDVSAWELAEQVKHRFPQVMTVLLSMWEDDTPMQRRQIFDLVITKPFEADTVIHSLQDLVQQRMRMVDNQ